MAIAGDRVEVPSHKSRNRTWDPGTVENVNRGIARVRLDSGRVVHAPVGMLAREETVRCPVVDPIRGACTGCRYCEPLWDARESRSYITSTPTTISLSRNMNEKGRA